MLRTVKCATQATTVCAIKQNLSSACVCFVIWSLSRHEKRKRLNKLRLFLCLLHLVPPLREDAGTEAEVVRLIVAIRGRALGHDRPIVGVTDPNLDQSRRRSRPKSRRNPKNLTRRRRKKVRTRA